VGEEENGEVEEEEDGIPRRPVTKTIVNPSLTISPQSKAANLKIA